MNDPMTPVQQRAQELFLSTAVLENNFTPSSEAKIAEALKLEGYEASSSSVGRWKKKFEFEKLLHLKITASVTEDKRTRDIIANSSLDAVVKNTEVDITRNNLLIAASYQALEYEANLLLQIVEKGEKPLTEDQFDRLYKIARLSTDRHDRMLDRLANMPPEAISSEEVIKRLDSIKVDYEEAEVLETQTMTLSHINEEE